MKWSLPCSCKQMKETTKSACLCVQPLQKRQLLETEAATMRLSYLASSLLFTGQAEREGKGVWHGQASAQCQIRQSPTRPQAPCSPVPRMLSARLNRSPKTYRSSCERPRKINMTGERAGVLRWEDVCSCSERDKGPWGDLKGNRF